MNNREKDKAIITYYILAGFFFALGLFILIFFTTHTGLIHTLFSSSDDTVTDFGQIGDFVGGVVGSLWSLAGIILFFIAVRLQSKELKNQREQLKIQSESLKNEIIELKETREVFLLQNFENTFFNLLENQWNIRNKIYFEYDFNGVSRKYSGENFFSFAKEVLVRLYDFYLPDDKRQGHIDNIRIVNYLFSNVVDIYTRTELLRSTENDSIRLFNCCELFFLRFTNIIRHHYRHLFAILNFLKTHETELGKFRTPLDYSTYLVRK